jgi:hypothetical protein
VASLVTSNGISAVSPNSLLASNSALLNPTSISATGVTTGVSQEINTSEYLGQLIKDKNQLAAFPNVFIHLERLLDEGISRFKFRPVSKYFSCSNDSF